MSFIGDSTWRTTAIVAMTLMCASIGADAQVQYKTGDVQQGTTSNRCCFNNFRFSGTCEARIGQNESCHDVLSYLNNFNSVGRVYCGNTTVRGGWTVVDCAPGSATFEIETNQDTLNPESAVGAPRARSPQNTQPIGTSSVGTQSQNFVTPISPTDVQAQEAGIINL